MSLFILTQSRKGAKRKVDALSFPNSIWERTCSRNSIAAISLQLAITL